MGIYEELLIKHDDISIIETNELPSFQPGCYINGEIYINRSLSEVRKVEVLREELSHHRLTWGDITDQSKFNNRKFENYARRYGFESAFPLCMIIEAYHSGVSNLYELANYVQISEEHVLKIIEHYKIKYGLDVYYKGYVIKFEPLQVFEHHNWD